ncbi:septum formation inhibitor Maf [Costertonia aggregata]|uniref:Septum formation inhibitor Maf n=1 Tax=Costertonia aggregata TaxID=343403 RepID=A0A7H9AU76_9FLAO|nr:septum formation inhibitor Maf [Costertonia aggregata]QLG46755.1 septum formation inhibitor Maf [Costertonia aggregata]
MFKNWFKLEISMVLLAALTSTLQSCKEVAKNNDSNIALNTEKPNNTKIKPKKQLSEEFKKYWYAGNAEITSYKIEQARYGQLREGNSVLIYVTEPFLNDKQVKADGANPDNIPVLKLNHTKNYLTGIYPYSIMSSSFYPVHDNQHAIKVSFSSQEWCGQVYAQLNNKDKFKVQSRSYFESEADQNLELEKTVLENELWNKIRINPSDLPIGELKIIPSMEYIRLSHKELKAYTATATSTTENGINIYSITYPELDRTLEIKYASEFPYAIEGWSETSKSGYGANAKTLTSKATKIKTMNTPYWTQNSNSDVYLRDSLGL